MILMALLTAAHAFANDGHAAIGVGGIEFRKSTEIRMKSEKLTVAMDKIEVAYIFANDADKDVVTTVAFPLPKMTCGEWGANKTIDDFVTKVAGKSVKMKKEEKAFRLKSDGSLGAEITKDVQAAGLPLDCRITYKDKKLFEKAQKAKLAGDSEDNRDILYVTQIVYYWEQKFPAKSTLAIEHSYIPMPGVQLLGSRAMFDKLGLKWVEGNSKNQIAHFVEYVLSTAKTWKGTIEDFHLVVKRDKPEADVGSTLGPLKKVDERTFEFRAKKFTPDRDLTVVWIH